VHFAYAIEGWRARSGADVARWIDVVGEMEALAALAGYAYERPDEPFPAIVDEGPRVEAAELGHPLIPRAKCMRNDIALGGELRLLVVSGSNMSGKSTMLRTVGINVVLALAGAPVRARTMTVSPLQVGATLRIQDSLAEGASRFYAEITRLKQLVDLSRAQPPLLFLLDEILAGTNSHDRRIGAEAVVRGLIDRGAIGLVTTHDLALAEVAEALAPRARNVHFEDRMVDGKLEFDYRMRDGVVQHSNAIALMRAVGLEI
jgi:DNA mismatch repair ATPase MutS